MGPSQRVREPPVPERDTAPPPKKPRPTPIAPKPSTDPSFAPPASFEDDDIQEVAPVKSEPREPAPAHPPSQQQQPLYEAGSQGGTVALDDYGDYGDAAYDDGQYGEEGYDSYYDPSTGQPIGGDGNKGLREELLQYLGKLSSTEFICLVCQYRGAQKHHV